MASRIGEILLELGEERFRRGMEELASSERREVFQALGVPPGGAAASARQRTTRRIRAAWEHLVRDPNEAAAEAFARHWLARNRMEMIRAFLNGLGVDHEDGYLQDEEALRNVPGDKMAAGLQQLMDQHDPGDVRLYAALMDLPEPRSGTP